MSSSTPLPSPVPAAGPHTSSDLAHLSCRLCAAPAEAAWRHLSSAAGLARWNLGLWGCEEVSAGLVTGCSLFDGSRAYARLEADAARLTIDYAVGATPDALVPRIQARIVPGALLGHAEGCCLVMLQAWRPAGMDDQRWARLVTVHEAELELIRGQLEHDAAPAAAAAQAAR